MKYFDYELLYGDVSDEIFNERINKYQNYITSIYSKIPCGFKLLARGINLHDTIIREFHWNKINQTVILECDCVDLDVGVFHLILKYIDVYNTINLKAFEPSKRYKHTEIYVSEIELLDTDYISHKMFFTTKKEIDIISKTVALQIEPSSLEIHKIPHHIPCNIIVE